MVMATDTAFAVGVLALVGRRSSLRLRIFLLTLVIVDDVAAISVIAVVYSTQRAAARAGGRCRVARRDGRVATDRRGNVLGLCRPGPGHLAGGLGRRRASHGGWCRGRPADGGPPAAPGDAPGGDRRDPSVPSTAEPCAGGRGRAPHHHVTLAQRATPARPASLDELRDRAAVPHCAGAAPVVLQLLERFAGSLRFVWRHLPLPDVHPNAALAAEAAEAAGAQGDFWGMHDRLFERQDDLGLPDLIDRARRPCGGAVRESSARGSLQ